MAKAKQTEPSAETEPTVRPDPAEQPFCTGCTRYESGTCSLLTGVLSIHGDQAVVTDCSHYDAINPPENTADTTSDSPTTDAAVIPASGTSTEETAA